MSEFNQARETAEFFLFYLYNWSVRPLFIDDEDGQIPVDGLPPEDIVKKMTETESAQLTVEYKGNRATILFIWENGEDVVSNYTYSNPFTKLELILDRFGAMQEDIRREAEEL